LDCLGCRLVSAVNRFSAEDVFTYACGSRELGSAAARICAIEAGAEAVLVYLLDEGWALGVAVKAR